MTEKQALELYRAIQTQETVKGLTHTFYRYPARFSPVFARVVIESFTEKGDIVYDPFMGGGTTIVEASALGRQAIGSDINTLAVYVSKVKTTPLDEEDLSALKEWPRQVRKTINIRAKTNPDSTWCKEGYHRNISCKKTWRMRKIIEVALEQCNQIPSERQREFVRCSILKTAQRALDCSDNIPSVKDFRKNLFVNLTEMIEGAKQYTASLENSQGSSKLANLSVIGVDQNPEFEIPAPKLILTSPPYPGLHILYHRWQVLGRRETPAPYWIANCLDNHGEAYYGMGNRKQKSQDTYFLLIKDAFTSLANISNQETVIVQVISFANPKEHLPRYLKVLEECGFREFFVPGICEYFDDGRLWRSVPNRKWYTSKTTSSNDELVLFHQKLPVLNH